MRKQPAKVNYYFDKCYKDIGNSLKSSWEASMKPCVGEAKRIKKKFTSFNFIVAIFLSVFDFIVFTFMTVFGTAASLIISTVLIIIFVMKMSVIYVGYTVVKTVDTAFCIIYGICHKCPNCQRNFFYPVYVCPECGAKHDRLVPSKYGILTRICECGHKLPTSFLNGRQKLDAVCPYCMDISATRIEKNSRDVCSFPVIGGPGSGKTCFITSAITLIEKKTVGMGWIFGHIFSENDEYENNIRRFSDGVVPDKTGNTRLNYYRFTIRKKEDDIKSIVSLCDVAGEAYSVLERSNQIIDQIGFRFSEGLIMIIDPLSIPGYKNDILEKGIVSEDELSGYKGSVKPIHDVIAALINALKNMMRVGSSQAINTSLAIVFTKCDIPGLEDEIGKPAVERYIKHHPGVTESEAQNEVCLDFLKKYGEYNFINTCKNGFKYIRFFTSSALGHNDDGKPFAPEGASEPVLWLMSHCKRKIFPD